MNHKYTKKLLIILMAGILSAKLAIAGDQVEVLHWWTSGGEAGALKVLKENLEKKGIKWVDIPISGGGGSAAMTALRARISSKNPPAASQMLGFDITDWAERGDLTSLNEIAKEESWDKTVPKALQNFSKYDGNWVATPVNVHSTNWVWANKKILDKLDIKEPNTWDEFVAAMKKIKDAGYIALAHGGQAWQEATIFDGIVLSVGGPEFYKKAIIDLDKNELASKNMEEVFSRMKVLRSFVDDNMSGRDWNLATAMVINDKAAFQIMGDWAKGEFLRSNKIPGKDFLCFRVPGSKGSITFNSDQFAMFKGENINKKAQMTLAAEIMSPAFQSAFNVIKGSVPARTDVSDKAFDACGKKAIAQLADADKNNTLLGSMGHGHAVPASIKNAFYDVITAHFNGEYDEKTAVQELVDAIEIAK